MFKVLFQNHIKLIVRQSLYWGTSLFVIAFAIVFYNLYFVDQATSFWDGETSPPARYMIVYLGGIPLVVMMLVSCFLSTRTYAKEFQFKIKEVLFTKLFGNVVHALSATGAATLFCALPIIVFIVCLSLGSFVQGWFNVDVAEPFELASTCVFLVFTTLVSLNFASVLSYYLYHAIRNTILSVLTSTAIVIGVIYLLTRVSFNQFVLFEFLPLVGDVASDMIASKLDIFDYIRFFAFICLCATLTVSSTWFLSRRDQHEQSRIMLCGSFGAITCASVAILLLSWFNQLSNVEKWQQHVMTVNDDFTMELQKLSGSVTFTPGINLEAEITIIGTLDDNISPDEQLVFWLNPGFNVQMVQADNREVNFEFDAGKLGVNLNRAKVIGESIELIVKYRGKPNTRYGYQDSSLDVANMPYWDQLISYYGMSPGIFDRKYIALPQATHWLPTSITRSSVGIGSIDFINADLTITVPSNWVATMSGSVAVQEIDATDDRLRTVQFTSQQPLAGISLYASDMTMYSTYLDSINVSLELYASDRHVRSFQEILEFEKYLPVLKTLIVEKIEEAQALGYSFPCETYRFVAVPSDLRLYDGGTFMDSLITAPCVFLIREHGPIATNTTQVRGGGDDLSWIYRMHLDAYFETRNNGGNMIFGLASHYFEFQSGFLGVEGPFLRKVLSYLHNHTWSRVPPNPSPYTPSVFFPREMKVKRMTPKAEYLAGIHHMPMDDNTLQTIIRSEVTFRKTLTDYVKRYTRHIDQTDVVFNHFLESDAVVNIAVQNSLKELVTLEPNALRQEAIRLRCIALAEKIYNFLGRENSRQLLQTLTNKFQHQNISVSDVFDTGESLDLPVKEIMAGWFDETEHFNFSFSPAIFSKRIDPDTQDTYYQVSFAVANTGTTAGVFRTSLRVAPDPTEFVLLTDPEDERRVGFLNMNNAVYASGPRILIPAGETQDVGIVTPTIPYRVNLKSYDVSYVNEISLLVRYDHLVNDSVERIPFEGNYIPKCRRQIRLYFLEQEIPDG